MYTLNICSLGENQTTSVQVVLLIMQEEYQ